MEDPGRTRSNPGSGPVVTETTEVTTATRRGTWIITSAGVGRVARVVGLVTVIG